MKRMMFDSVVSDAQLETLLTDFRWFASEKIDGKGCFVEYESVSGKVTISNLTGKPVKWIDVHLEKEIAAFGKAFGESFFFRGELDRSATGSYETGTIRVWESLLDINSPFWKRYQDVDQAFSKALQAGHRHNRFVLHEVTCDTWEKRALLAQAREDGCEGLVFCHMDGKYQPDRRVSTVLKYKFVETADLAIVNYGNLFDPVIDPNGHIHVSVGIAARDGDTLRGLASVQVAFQPALELQRRVAGNLGQLVVIEVAYLYATRNAGVAGSLVQPIFKAMRGDKVAIEDVTSVNELRYSNLFA